jgi:hypothetical protein
MINQSIGTPQIILSTELDNIAGDKFALGQEISLVPIGCIKALLELNITFHNNPSSSSRINIWFLRTIDGINYEDTNPIRIPDLIIPINSQLSIRTIWDCQVPACKFKTLLQNYKTGQALSTGNTVKILPVIYANS